MLERRTVIIGVKCTHQFVVLTALPELGCIVDPDSLIPD